MPSLRRTRGLALGVLLPLVAACSSAPAQAPTATPIKHLIVVVGENVSFDALFGTYQPVAGEGVPICCRRGS